MVFKPDPWVDPGQILGHRLSGLAKVTQINLAWKNIKRILKNFHEVVSSFF
jgi:hypothetical protein